MLLESVWVLVRIFLVFKLFMLLYLVKVDVVIEFGLIMFNWIFFSLDVYMDSVYDVFKELELLID